MIDYYYYYYYYLNVFSFFFSYFIDEFSRVMVYRECVSELAI